MRLMDKVAIITGAAQGIGAAFALGYAGEGAKVVIAGILDGKEAVDAVEKTDVTQPEDCETMAQKTIDRFGSLDILINNAAMIRNILPRPFMGISTGD